MLSSLMDIVDVIQGFESLKKDEEFARNIEKLVGTEQTHQLKYNV